MNVGRNLCGYFSLIEKFEHKYLLGCDVIKEMLLLNFNLYMEEKQYQDAINVAKTMYDNGANRYRNSAFVNYKEEKYSIFDDDAHFEEFLRKCFVG